jgi:CheY-like chemotaxis protein
MCIILMGLAVAVLAMAFLVNFCPRGNALSSDARKDLQNTNAVLHDVRQMLAVISGRVGLLRRHCDDEKIIKNLDAMEIAATDAGKMLARLQGNVSSANEAGDAPTDIRQAILQSAALIQPTPGRDWIVGTRKPPRGSVGAWHLQMSISEGCFTSIPAFVLREVLNNLFLNSLEVMPDGGSVSASLERAEDQWCLRFQDSGPGIPRNLQARIFDVGFTTSGVSGRGIGLGNCQDLLSRHDSLMALDSTAPAGACFELSLPLAVHKRVNDVIPEATGTVFEPPVLVVDDELSVREMLEDVLVELGCQVELAKDGSSGQKVFPTRDFELVIIDQSLPGLSGLELATALRRADHSVVLVLMSGWGHPMTPESVAGSVVDFFVEKPITLGDLKTLLNKAGEVFRQRQQEP